MSWRFSQAIRKTRRFKRAGTQFEAQDRQAANNYWALRKDDAMRPTSTLSQRIHLLWNKKQARHLAPAIAAALTLAAGLLFWLLAARVNRGHTAQWDEQILRALRRADDQAVLVGPRWLQEAGLDVTALGSPLVLGICIITSVGFLYFEGQRRVAILTMLTTGGGALLSLALKELFTRPRPDVVPHLREVVNSSFPSGHSMGAAVVYLTLGTMFMKSFRSRRAKIFCLTLAVLLTVAVGVSRVYLGVHYPSDVLGGWVAGISWSLGCWALGELVPSRPLPDSSDTPTGKTRT
jgi:undecaprenyl-diphosphatase